MLVIMISKKNGYDDKGIYLKNVTLIITSLNLLISLVIFGLFKCAERGCRFIEDREGRGCPILIIYPVVRTSNTI